MIRFSVVRSVLSKARMGVGKREKAFQPAFGLAAEDRDLLWISIKLGHLRRFNNGKKIIKAKYGSDCKGKQQFYALCWQLLDQISVAVWTERNREKLRGTDRNESLELCPTAHFKINHHKAERGFVQSRCKSAWEWLLTSCCVTPSLNVPGSCSILLLNWTFKSWTRVRSIPHRSISPRFLNAIIVFMILRNAESVSISWLG